MTRDVCYLALAVLSAAGMGLAVAAGWWAVAVVCGLEIVAALVPSRDE